MFVSESQMENEEQMVALFGVDRGVAYQTTGALLRLGRKMLGIVEQPSQRALVSQVPMVLLSEDDDFQKHFKSDVSWTLLVAGENQAQDIARIKKIQGIAPQMKWVFILPQQTSAEHVEALLSLSGGRCVVFLVPHLFGFRDNGLMDESLRLLKEKPKKLHDKTNGQKNASLLFVGDLVSLIVSVPQLGSAVWGRVFVVPGFTCTEEEWLEAFRKSFSVPMPSVWDSFKRVFPSFSSGVFKNISMIPNTPLVAQAEDFKVSFPTSMTSLRRALDQCASSYKRHPQLELVFPPGRTI